MPVPLLDLPIPLADSPIPLPDLPVPLPDSPIPLAQSPLPPEQPSFSIEYQHWAHPNVNIDTLSSSVTFQPMRDTMDFIIVLRDVSTSDPIGQLSEDALDWLQNPPNIPLIIKSPGIHYSISTYLALEHSPQDAYEQVCRATTQNFPEAVGIGDVQSFYNVEKLICTFTAIEPIHHDMCPNTCLAYTALLNDLDARPTCGASWWNEQKLQGSNSHIKVPAQTFTTIPLSPQLQARIHSPESA